MGELWVIPLVIAAIGGIYWDIRRIRKMVVPPPPKPAPLPIKEKFQEDLPFDAEEYADALLALHKSFPDKPINQMTHYEWAHIHVLIAEAQLDTARTIAIWMKTAAFIFIVALWPEKWWIYVPIFMFGNLAIEWPFLKAWERAYERAEKLDNR